MKQIFDFAIIGAGAAGLQLADQLIRDPELSDRSILILDKVEKHGDDHTWSYWEKGSGPYDDILWSSWKKAVVYAASGKRKELVTQPYQYKSIRSSSFYTLMKTRLKHANVSWLRSEVIEVIKLDTGTVQINASSGEYLAKHCFDSRIPKGYFSSSANTIHILQHFKGWLIRTKEPIFKSDEFVMMDFRLRYQDHTSFFYILPQSENEALVEFTLFDHTILAKEEYDDYLSMYLTEILNCSDYEIVDSEEGVIPMTTYPFKLENDASITKIGTAGGWVRPSSGYGFYNSYRNAQIIVNNIKANRSMTEGIYNNLHLWFDKIFLRVLDRENHVGPKVFEAIYTNNKLRTTFRFLDGQSNFLENIKMILSVPWLPFLRALKKTNRLTQ